LESYLRELGREIGEIKGKLDQLLDVVPIMAEHTEKITRLEEGLKSAHKRVDSLKKEIYTNVVVAVGAVQLLFYFIEKLGGK
jgi:hypothetical protein